MDERTAAELLHDGFYQWLYSRGHPGEYIPKVPSRNGSLIPRPAVQWALDERRALLLPEDFRFTWPNLPEGAHYI